MHLPEFDILKNQILLEIFYHIPIRHFLMHV